MGKKLSLILLCLALLFTASACGKGESTENSNPQNSASQGSLETNTKPDSDGIVKIFEEEKFDYKNYDFLKLIKDLAFDKSTKIGSKASEVLEIELLEINEHSIKLKIKAPYIKQELTDWYEENYSGTASLEDEILKLLSGEKKEYVFTLNYYASKGEPHLDYSAEFSSAVTCGILDFSNYMEALFLKELEDGVYD